MSEKTCDECQNHHCKQTGPHEWVHRCLLGQSAFPFEADHCAFYQPAPVLSDEGERWPSAMRVAP